MQHVLVVDQPAISAVVQICLETDGTCRVTAVSTMAEAVAVMMRDRPDAAIIDVVLGPGAGLALASRAVDLGIPVLFMTGEPHTQSRLSAAGCPYLAKPFHLASLIAETRALFDDRLQRRAEVRILLHRLAAESEALSAVVERAREARAREALAKAQHN
jgi:DNA-binding response OmpR family regulator